MKIVVTLTQHTGVAFAKVEYDRKIINVLVGSKISSDLANYIQRWENC